MDVSGGDLVAKILRAEGVEQIFTLCGGHILPIYDGCLTEGIRVVDLRHEQAAAHAADACARLRRGIGCAVVTAGPGVTDAVTGVANAHAARSPLLLIGGAPPLALRGMGALQEMPQVDLLRPITKGAWSVSETRRIPDILATAMRTALSGCPGPVFVEIPVDILMNRVDWEERELPRAYVSRSVVYADPADVERAAALMAQAQRPVVVAGSGVYWDDGAKALQSAVEKAGLPVFMNGAGRGCLGADHPLAFQHSRSLALGQADVALVLGTPLDFRLGYGRTPTFSEQVRVVMVDVDGAEIGRNRPIDVGIVANTRVFLEQLAEALPGNLARRWEAWRQGLRAEEEEWWGKQAPLLASDQVPIHHYRFAREVAAAVGLDTIVVGDGGDIVGCASKVVRLQHPGQWLDPGPFGCLGIGAPFAIASKLKYPDRKVLVISGDGSFGLNGMDFETALRFNLPMVCVVGNDAGWGQIRSPQLSFFGEGRSVGTSLVLTRYDEIVRGMGGHGEYVTEPGQLAPALERAFASGTVACVNVVIDPASYRATGQVSMAI